MLLRPRLSLVMGLGNIIPRAASSHATTDALNVTIPSNVSRVALNLAVAMTICVGAGDEAEEEKES